MDVVGRKKKVKNKSNTGFSFKEGSHIIFCSSVIIVSNIFSLLLLWARLVMMMRK